MRVCVLWPRLGPYHLARLRASHARLGREGLEVVALETASQDETYEWREERAAEPFRRVTALPGRSFEATPPREIATAIAAALDAEDPAAVAINSYSAPDSRAALAWCRRRRRPAVLMMESKADDAPRAAPREAVKGAIVRAFDAALAGGTPQREYLGALGFPPEAVFQPYDVVDNDFFACGAEAARRAPEAWAHLPGVASGDPDFGDGGPRPFFLASARFVTRKNLRRLLEAYAVYRTQARGEPWRLVLLGDGPERERLERIAASGAATPEAAGVTFAGFRQIDELPAYYGLAGAFVHVPLVEQWGLVVNEAMAAGLPVVVSRQTGCSRDLVRGNGRRVDGLSEAEIADALAWVSAPETDRAAMGARSREIVAGWSPEAFAEGLLAAVRAARSRADRPMPLAARAALAAMHGLQRSVTSFYAIRE